MDLVRLLAVYAMFKRRQAESIAVLKQEMSSSIFDPFIERKRRATKAKPSVGERRRGT